MTFVEGCRLTIGMTGQDSNHPVFGKNDVHRVKGSRRGPRRLPSHVGNCRGCQQETRPGKAEVPEPDDPVVVDGNAEDRTGLVSVINGPAPMIVSIR
jgi:hypothetical protein